MKRAHITFNFKGNEKLEEKFNSIENISKFVVPLVMAKLNDELIVLSDFDEALVKKFKEDPFGKLNLQQALYKLYFEKESSENRIVNTVALPEIITSENDVIEIEESRNTTDEFSIIESSENLKDYEVISDESELVSDDGDFETNYSNIEKKKDTSSDKEIIKETAITLNTNNEPQNTDNRSSKKLGVGNCFKL